MKLLVCGCSLSSGWGYTSENISQHWPNQIAKRLNADLVNVSATGYDNTGLFLNLIEQLTKKEFDLCLFQVTALNRMIFSPNCHGHVLCKKKNFSNGRLTDEQYTDFYKKFAILNQDIEHWTRLLKIISSIQNLVNQGKNIKFINGILDWDKELFNQPTQSKFIKRTIDFDNSDDTDIAKFTQVVYNQAQTIDLSLWINPFVSLTNMRIDTIAPNDYHPGLRSQQLFTELIYKGIIK